MYGREAVKLRIDDLCKQRRISYYNLAYLSGLKLSTVMNIINGRAQNPTLLTIYRICTGLNITVQEFFSCKYFDVDFILEDE